jgi:hypothetical protein
MDLPVRLALSAYQYKAFLKMSQIRQIFGEIQTAGQSRNSLELNRVLPLWPFLGLHENDPPPVLIDSDFRS